MEFTIVTMTNQDPDFYPTLGPFLARREIIKALDEPLYDEDGKVWYVAVSSGWTVLGFATAMPLKHKIFFSSAYVLPEYRGNGIFKSLVNARLEAYPDAKITLVANSKSAGLYAGRGFEVDRETKNYKFMSRAANGKSN